jgi:hypothetical protein
VLSSWTIYISKCKSGLSAIARSCFLGREAAKERLRKIRQQQEEARVEAARKEAQISRLEQLEQQSQAQIAELTAERAQPQTTALSLGEAPPEMQYGARLIELCINLARVLGLRPTVHALEIFFQWLEAEVAIPAYQTVGTWMQRLGLARQAGAGHADGGVWLVDHSNQIGKEKVLVVLRVRERRAGAGALCQAEVEVLTVEPRESWKREDVLEVYLALAEKYGVPRAIASDGAPELQEPIALLGERLTETTAKKQPKTAGKRPAKPLALRDPKHFLANQLEALLTRDPAWQEFSKLVGSTRSAVQQTELAHFTPPAFKTKARFMNLERTLHWANAVLWHWDHPDSESRRDISPERMEAKLGWLRQFAPNLREWQACQEVVSTALTFLNERGLFRGAAEQLQKLIAKYRQHALCKQLIPALLKFVQGYEDQLQRGERLPMSTEILESCFAKYKQLEQQHSKSGFTSLLLTFPVLNRPTTAAEITASMPSVKTKDVQAWQQQNLPATLNSRRQLLYREANPKRKRNRAMPITTNN